MPSLAFCLKKLGIKGAEADYLNQRTKAYVQTSGMSQQEADATVLNEWVKELEKEYESILDQIQQKNLKAPKEERRKYDAYTKEMWESVVGKVDKIETARRIMRELVKQLYTDPLTGIGSRAAFMEQVALDERLPVNQRRNIVMMDLDNFSFFNEILGHATGDKVLKTVGKALQKYGVDAYRIGGEEFALLVKDDRQAAQAAMNIQAALEKHLIVTQKLLDTRKLSEDEQPYHPGETLTIQGIGVSYGIDKIYSRADAALKKEKESREKEGVRAKKGAEIKRLGRKGAQEAGPGAEGERLRREGVHETFTQEDIVLSVQAQEKRPTFVEALSDKWEKRGVTLDVFEGRRKIDLQMIEVPKERRKEGLGTEILNELVDHADRVGKRIELTPGLKDDLHGTTSRGRLVKFYKRFGFKENKGRNKDFTTSAGMYREPQINRPEAMPPHSTAFKRWFGKSVVVDDDGAAMMVFHGSTHTGIDVYRTNNGSYVDDLAGYENYMGPGAYFTSEIDDANKNYVGMGQDLKNKIGMAMDKYQDLDRWAEEDILREYFTKNSMQQELKTLDETVEKDAVNEYRKVPEDPTKISVEAVLYDDLVSEHWDEALKSHVHEQLVGEAPEGVMYPAYLRIEKPFHVDETFFEYTVEWDESTGEVVKEGGPAENLITRFIGELIKFETDGMVTELRSELYRQALDNEGLTGKDVLEAMSRTSIFAYDGDTGIYISGGTILRMVAEDMGYDGMVMNAWTHFGPKVIDQYTSQGMAGVYQGTKHFLPFKSNQIKSAIGNVGTFDTNTDAIDFSVRHGYGKQIELPFTERKKAANWLNPAFPYVQPVQIKMPGVAPFAEGIGGYTQSLALTRARANWLDAEWIKPIGEPIPREDRETWERVIAETEEKGIFGEVERELDELNQLAQDLAEEDLPDVDFDIGDLDNLSLGDAANPEIDLMVERLAAKKWADVPYEETRFKIINNRVSKELYLFELLFGESSKAIVVPGKGGMPARGIMPSDLLLELYRVVESGEVADLLNRRNDPMEIAISRGLSKRSPGRLPDGKRMRSPAEDFVHFLNKVRRTQLLIPTDEKGKPILTANAKAGISADLLLAFCDPTEQCIVCYAADTMIREDTWVKAFRNSLHLLSNPDGYATQVAAEAARLRIPEFPFIRLLGSGDFTTIEQVKAYNKLAKIADRPIHIFSRHHEMLRRLKGNSTAPFLMMGSIDATLYQVYGHEFLVENMQKFGIANAWLYLNPTEIPTIEALHNEDALGLILSSKPELHVSLSNDLRGISCPCDAKIRSHLGSCRQCAMSLMGCMTTFNKYSIGPDGKMWRTDDPKMPKKSWPVLAYFHDKDTVSISDFIMMNKGGTIKSRKEFVLRAKRELGTDKVDPDTAMIKPNVQGYLASAIQMILKSMKDTRKQIRKIKAGSDIKLTLPNYRFPGDAVVTNDLEQAELHLERLAYQLDQAYMGKTYLVGDLDTQKPVAIKHGQMLADATTLTAQQAADLSFSVASRWDDSVYTEKERQFANETAKHGFGDDKVPKLARSLVRGGDRVLDFGAGLPDETGKLPHVEALKEMGATVDAYEFGDNVDPEVHNADALSKRYDIVYGSNVLNVQGSPSAFDTTLERMITATSRNGGRLIVNMPEVFRRGFLADISHESALRLVRQRLRDRFLNVVHPYIDGKKDTEVFLAAGKRQISLRQTEAQKRTLSSPEFKAWFGDSKIVDKDGAPQVVYHATWKTDFSSFRPDIDHAGDESLSARGIFSFTTDAAFASRWLGYWDTIKPDQARAIGTARVWGKERHDRIYPVYLRVEKPFDFRKEDHVNLFVNWIGSRIKEGDVYKYMDESQRDEWLKDKLMRDEAYIRRGDWELLENTLFLKAHGFDGVYTLERDALNINVLDPTQIKSIYNRGTFDTTAEDIMLSVQHDEWRRQMHGVLQKKLPGKGSAQHYLQLLDRLASPPEHLAEKLGQLEKEHREKVKAGIVKQGEISPQLKAARGAVKPYKGEFKREELEWSGLLEWLENKVSGEDKAIPPTDPLFLKTGKKAKPLRVKSTVVRSKEIMDFLDNNRVEIHEVLYGPSEMSDVDEDLLEDIPPEEMDRDDVRYEIWNYFMEEDVRNSLDALVDRDVLSEERRDELLDEFEDAAREYVDDDDESKLDDLVDATAELALEHGVQHDVYILQADTYRDTVEEIYAERRAEMIRDAGLNPDDYEPGMRSEHRGKWRQYTLLHDVFDEYPDQNYFELVLTLDQTGDPYAKEVKELEDKIEQLQVRIEAAERVKQRVYGAAVERGKRTMGANVPAEIEFGRDERQDIIRANQETPQATLDIRAAKKELAQYKVALYRKIEQFTNTTHWGDPLIHNPLFHVRLHEFHTAAGELMLFIDELQSDWHQSGRKQGYRKPPIITKRDFKRAEESYREQYDTLFGKSLLGDYLSQKTERAAEAMEPWEDLTDAERRYYTMEWKKENSRSSSGRVSDAPFKKTWTQLAIKRILRWAVENGYNKIGWTSGAIQDRRYPGIHDFVHTLRTQRIAAGKGEIQKYKVWARIYDRDGQQRGALRDTFDQLNVQGQTEFNRYELERAIGKDFAQLTIDSEKEENEYVVDEYDENYEIGNLGMRTFYDQILVNEFNHMFGKKSWGAARVEQERIEFERVPFMNEFILKEQEAIGWEHYPSAIEKFFADMSDETAKLVTMNAVMLDHRIFVPEAFGPEFKKASAQGHRQAYLEGLLKRRYDTRTWRAILSAIWGGSDSSRKQMLFSQIKKARPDLFHKPLKTYRIVTHTGSSVDRPLYRKMGVPYPKKTLLEQKQNREAMQDIVDQLNAGAEEVASPTVFTIKVTQQMKDKAFDLPLFSIRHDELRPALESAVARDAMKNYSQEALLALRLREMGVPFFDEYATAHEGQGVKAKALRKQYASLYGDPVPVMIGDERVFIGMKYRQEAGNDNLVFSNPLKNDPQLRPIADI